MFEKLSNIGIENLPRNAQFTGPTECEKEYKKTVIEKLRDH